MATREFTDSNGVTWRVWSTVPSGTSVRVTKYADGWLTFESGDSLRRLTPLPSNWENASDERLELMCRAATDVRRHTGPFPRLAIDPPANAPGSDNEPGEAR
jgi:hypothetical protein